MLKTRAHALLAGVLAGALILGFGVFLGSLVRVPPSNNPPTHEASAQTNPDGNEKKHAGNPHWGFTAEEWIAIGTVTLAGGTFLLAVATIGLWGVTRRGVKTQIDDTRILQRAYLAVAGGGVYPFNGPLPPHTVANIVVRNTGNLPARDVSWLIDYCLSPDGQLGTFPIDETRFFGKNVVPPGTDMWRSQNCELDPQDLIGFEHDSWFLYVWGEIRYVDGFNTSRFTKFCHRYDNTARGFGDRVTNAGHVGGVALLKAEGMRFHQFGNDAD